MTKTDRSKLIPNLDYLKRELPFVSEYKMEVDWKVYQNQFYPPFLEFVEKMIEE